MKKKSEIVSMENKERVPKITRTKLILTIFAILLLVLQMFFNVFLLLEWKELKEQVNLALVTGVFQKEKTYMIQDDAPVYESDNEEQVPSTQVKDPVISSVKKTDHGKSSKSEAKSKVQRKKIYLTFDDGPSIYTKDILEILEKYQVKATFFVIGKTDDSSIKMYQRIVREGHTLAMHSYSHKYDEIYGSVKNFDKDFKKISNLLYDSTGLRPKYYRFPGGSSNQVSKVPMKKFTSYLAKKDVVYFDWNVVNGDAEKKELSTKVMTRRVLEDVKKYNTSIVLMHDTAQKASTVKFLPGLIERLLKDQCEILPIDENTTVVHHRQKVNK